MKQNMFWKKFDKSLLKTDKYCVIIKQSNNLDSSILMGTEWFV